MSKRRVFILGAGFSKQAGLPLATELTSLILDETELKDLEDMQAWVADLKQRVAATEGTGEDASRFPLNIEQLFDFAKYDEELCRMKQQLCPVGREWGDTDWATAESISSWLRYMEEKLPHVIWDAQTQGNLEIIRRFTDQISGDDTILTFNYDTLVETGLSARGQTWNHGLNDRNNGGVTVLKMHGSVDWILLKRRAENQLEKFVKLFSKKDANAEEHGSNPRNDPEYDWELWRAKDTSTCNAVIDMDKSGLSNFRYFLGFAGLGQCKPLHQLPGSALTWVTAFKELNEADEIYVVGFSMSPYDRMSRFHFTSVMRQRAKPPIRVVVIDPCAASLGETFSSVFGKQPILKAVEAQGVEWSELLA